MLGPRTTMTALALLWLCQGCGATDESATPTPERGEREADPATDPAVDPEAEPLPLRCDAEPRAADEALLAFSIQGTHGAAFSERLTLRCDGRVEVLAPYPWSSTYRHRPGRYAGTISGAELDAAVALARRLTLPTPPTSLPPQGADTAVEVFTSGARSFHELRPGPGSADGEAFALLERLNEVAAEGPVSALSATVVRAASPLVAGRPGRVAVRLTNPGRHPVAVGLSVDGLLRVTDAAGASWYARAPDDRPMFLDQDQQLFDPWYGLGELPPGGSALTTVEVTPPRAGSVELRVELSGQLELRDGSPVAANWIAQGVPFHLWSEPATLEVGAAEP